MKKSLQFAVLLLTVFALAGCNGSKKNGNNSTTDSAATAEQKSGNGDTDTPAKGDSMNSEEDSKSQVTAQAFGKIMVVYPYCGGAAPTEEILEEARRPRPYANKIMYIHRGSTNTGDPGKIWTVETNSEGQWEIELPLGTYCMVLEEKDPNQPDGGFQQPPNTNYDAECGAKWQKNCDQYLIVTAEGMRDNILTFKGKCYIQSLNPCLTWEGPLPPAAAPPSGDR